ncbi:hypothetical protein [Hymenobacter sp. B81]|uniref:hypothetical protein n=1 Tax=Hymenobacter sp. B81 TaxID=3344878 RepID=UPI0037DD0DEF
MARTIQQIFDSLVLEKNSRTELAAINSPSAVALWRNWLYVVAASMWVLETLWDEFRGEVDAVIARARPGTPEWYADRALEFQAGDTLTVGDDGIRYAAGSTGAKIITRAAAKEATGNGLLKLFIKVAKDGSQPDTLQALDADELTQVSGYFDRIRFAGTRLEVVSRDADRLQVYGTVYYDPLLKVTDLKAAVAKAIRGYLASLDFDGQVYRARVEDAIQSVAGVKDVKLETVNARVGTAPLNVIQRVYETAAGYIVEDAAPLDFATTLTFLPHGTR